MNETISLSVKKHLLACGPDLDGRVVYTTDSVRQIAVELGISYETADKIVVSWINQNMVMRYLYLFPPSDESAAALTGGNNV